MAFHLFGPGCFFLALLVFFEPKRTCKSSILFLVVVSFLFGIAYADIRKPTPAPEPSWLSENLTAQEVDPYGRERAKPITIQGTVGKVTPLNNKRYRFELQDATHYIPTKTETLLFDPAQKENSSVSAERYKGILLITLQLENTPITGQKFKGLVRLSRVRSFTNIGSWDAKAYWMNKGIWIRGFSGVSSSYKDSDAKRVEQTYMFSGEGDLLAKTHAQLKTAFLTTISLAGEINKNEEITGTSYAMLPALLFGDRSFLTPQQTDKIARSTLAHSLALSGLHLGYTVAIAVFLAFVIGKVFPTIYLHIARPYFVILVASPLAAIYVWLGGAPVSLLRATCMFIFWALLLLWKKPKVMLDGLIMAVVFLVLLDPTAILDISLQLSALSVATIAFSLPLIQGISSYILSSKKNSIEKKMPFIHRTLRTIIELLCISMIIQIVTGPLVLATFGVVGLWFPLNLIWLPVLGTIVMPFLFIGFFFSSLGITSLATLCFYIANIPCQELMNLLLQMDNLYILSAPAMLRPHWISIAGWWIICLAFFLWGKQKVENIQTSKKKRTPPFREKSITEHKVKKPVLITVGFLLFLSPICWGWYKYFTQPVGIHIFDVGQGQAILLEWEHGRAMIDGGGLSHSTFDIGKGLIAPLLTNNRPARVNYLVHSHPDTDHMAGLMYLLESFDVDYYVGNGDLPTQTVLERFTRALARKNMTPVVWKAGDILQLTPELQIEVLWPPKDVVETLTPGSGKRTNYTSLILRILWKKRPLALLCGDADARALRYLTKYHSEKLQAEVLVLPHHGSVSAFVPEFYEAVKPFTVIASCGWQNRWHFPAYKITEWFSNKGIPVYSTGASGEISFHWNESKQLAEIIFANDTFSKKFLSTELQKEE